MARMDAKKMQIVRFKTLTAVIQEHARREPNALALVFLNDDGSEEFLHCR